MMKNKIKVCYVFESYPFFYQPYIKYVIDSLNKNREIDFSIMALKKNEGGTKGVQYFKPYFLRKIWERASKLLHRTPALSYVENQLKNFDIIHVQHSFLLFKLKNLAKMDKSVRPKIIVTLRGSDTYVKPWMSKKWEAFYKNDSTDIDVFVVMSGHQKKYLMRWGVSENKIFIIPISFGEKFLAKPKLPNCNKVVVYSAFRMLWEKNIDGNLRVIKHLVAMDIPVHYHIYGEGIDSGQVYFLIDKYNLAAFVTYHRKVENDTLKKSLAAYDFYLQLSHSESLGMSVIEAQTLGIPAVVSNSGGLPEIVVHNNTGFVVESFDVENAAEYIQALWKQPNEYFKFSQNAITSSQEKYNTPKEIKNLLSVYQKLNN